jgi:hypothetical protein
MATLESAKADAAVSTDTQLVVDEPPHRLRTLFGVVLFVGWGILTIVWLASTVYLAMHGHFIAVITAATALALLLLLGGMEGLEVSVIALW